MTKTDTKLLNCASNYIELALQHFSEENPDNELMREIIFKMTLAKQCIDSASSEINEHRAILIKNR